jgi:hypothetical protein
VVEAHPDPVHVRRAGPEGTESGQAVGKVRGRPVGDGGETAPGLERDEQDGAGPSSLVAAASRFWVSAGASRNGTNVTRSAGGPPSRSVAAVGPQELEAASVGDALAAGAGPSEGAPDGAALAEHAAAATARTATNQVLMAR